MGEVLIGHDAQRGALSQIPNIWDAYQHVQDHACTQMASIKDRVCMMHACCWQLMKPLNTYRGRSLRASGISCRWDFNSCIIYVTFLSCSYIWFLLYVVLLFKQPQLLFRGQSIIIQNYSTFSLEEKTIHLFLYYLCCDLSLGSVREMQLWNVDAV